MSATRVVNQRRPTVVSYIPTHNFRLRAVSTADQNPDHQIDALIRASVAEGDICIDTASGAKAFRPSSTWVLKLLRDDDTLKTTRLDRLGRSVLHLVTLGAQLRERGVNLHVIEQGIDTSTMEGWAMFGMLSVLAELQTWLSERPAWPGADTNALLLNARGGRLTDPAARDIITGLGRDADLGEEPGEPFAPHVLRHTFGTQLVRAWTDLVLVANSWATNAWTPPANTLCRPPPTARPPLVVTDH